MILVALLAGIPACSSPHTTSSPLRVAIGPITEFSRGCPGQNAEVEQAVVPMRDLVYEEWMGCGGQLAVAVSVDGGLRFGVPVVLPGSQHGWDPSIAVGPDGTVYAAFMVSAGRHIYPVVEASFDFGKTFPQVTRVVPEQPGNFGDRDFLAVGPTGTLYLTWDYGPSAKELTLTCAKGGSCSFATGDLNIVMQTSTDRGRTWGPMAHVSPGFPISGADSGPLLIEPEGRVFVDYQGYHMTSRTKLTMSTGHSYFTASGNGGKSWSAPVRIGPELPAMNRTEWWIDGDIASDSAGNLYATWDSQTGGRDVGWLSYSTDSGRTWSRPLRATPDTGKGLHIVQVAGGGTGLAYVGWLTNESPSGYAVYLRPFSIAHGWLSAPIRVSREYGNQAVWPGDTIGLSTQAPASAGPHAGWPSVVISWGSAVASPKAYSQDMAAVVAIQVGRASRR